MQSMELLSNHLFPSPSEMKASTTTNNPKVMAPQKAQRETPHATRRLPFPLRKFSSPFMTRLVWICEYRGRDKSYQRRRFFLSQ